MTWNPSQIAPTIEDKFKEDRNARALRKLAADGDLNGLLEYALLLNMLATMEAAKCRWAIDEALRATHENHLGRR